jgi:hypothetical protein
MKEWLLRGATRPRWFGTALTAFVGLAATLAFALPTTLLLSTQTTSAAPPDSAYSGTVVAVEGTDNVTYIRANLPNTPGYANLSLGWVSLGGLDPNGPPDVVDVGGQPLYIAIGTDNALWVRTIASTTWTRFPGLNGAPSFCRNSPGAVWSGRTQILFIGCQGSDNALWVANTPATAGQTSFSNVTWTSYGGGLASGPAVAFPSFSSAVMPSFAAMTPSGQVYYHGPSVTDAWILSDWNCTGSHLAANSNPIGDFSTAACRGPASLDGTFHAWFSPFPANQTFQADDIGGDLAAIAGPGVAWSSDDPGTSSIVYAQGTDNAVWARSVGAGPPVWQSLGGQAKNGVEAAYICSSVSGLKCTGTT